MRKKAIQSHQEIFDLLDFQIVSENWSNAFKLVQLIKINGTLNGLLSLMFSLQEGLCLSMSPINAAQNKISLKITHEGLIKEDRRHFLRNNPTLSGIFPISLAEPERYSIYRNRPQVSNSHA